MTKILLILLLSSVTCLSKQYNAIVTRVIDGDTFECNVDLGLDVTKKEAVRIYGIDAPEMKTPEGKKSYEFLNKALSDKQILIDNMDDKREKYGRLLCKVYLDAKDVGSVMIKAELAKEYYGGKRK